jgi:hypothetical protein
MPSMFDDLARLDGGKRESVVEFAKQTFANRYVTPFLKFEYGEESREINNFENHHISFFCKYIDRDYYPKLSFKLKLIGEHDFSSGVYPTRRTDSSVKQKLKLDQAAAEMFGYQIKPKSVNKALDNELPERIEKYDTWILTSCFFNDGRKWLSCDHRIFLVALKRRPGQRGENWSVFTELEIVPYIVGLIREYGWDKKEIDKSDEIFFKDCLNFFYRDKYDRDQCIRSKIIPEIRNYQEIYGHASLACHDEDYKFFAFFDKLLNPIDPNHLSQRIRHIIIDYPGLDKQLNWHYKRHDFLLLIVTLLPYINHEPQSVDKEILSILKAHGFEYDAKSIYNAKVKMSKVQLPNLKVTDTKTGRVLYPI